VLESGVPITLVPLDATNDVRVTRAFAERLHADASAGPANLVDELLLRSPYAIGVDYFWDVLAAVTIVEPSVVTTEEARIALAIHGADAGRTTRAADGTRILLATAADSATFEAAFLEGLRSGGPRRTAFELVDTIPVTFDGTVCAADVRSAPRSGTYQLSFVNDSALEAVAVVGGLTEDSTWADFDAWVRDHPGSIDQPPMVVVYGFVYLEPGAAGSSLAEFAPGDAFVTCLIASTGQEAVVAGPRFTVE
jgi:hypothetical protein